MNDLINLFATNTHMDLFWGVVALTVVFAIILAFVQWKKGGFLTVGIAFIMGIILLVLFGVVNHVHGATLDDALVDKTRDGFSMVSEIFIVLIAIVLPIYIFLVISNFILSDDVENIKARTYLVSFASLIGMVILGILVAILVGSIVFLLPNNIWTDWSSKASVGCEDEEGGILSTIVGIFTDWKLIIPTIFIAIYVAIGIRLATPKGSDKRESIKLGFSKALKYITTYFRYVIILVPFVVLTNLSTLGMTELESGTSGLAILLSYMGVWWVGGIIIFGILIGANLALATSNTTKKEKMQALLQQSVTVLATNSSQISLPETQATCRKLGVCDEISKLTPTKGTIMGMVMCNGFTPALILFFVIMMNNGGHMDWGMLFIGLAIVVCMAVAASGQGSADYLIATTAIGVMGGATITTSALMAAYTFLLPMQEINERTIRTTNNTLGHILATQITDRAHRKFGRCEEDKRNVRNTK